METLWKNKLQELCQKNCWLLPKYEASDRGPAEPSIRWSSKCTVTIPDVTTFSAESDKWVSSKGEAEQRAAKRLCEQLAEYLATGQVSRTINPSEAPPSALVSKPAPPIIHSPQPSPAVTPSPYFPPAATTPPQRQNGIYRPTPEPSLPNPIATTPPQRQYGIYRASSPEPSLPTPIATTSKVTTKIAEPLPSTQDPPTPQGKFKSKAQLMQKFKENGLLLPQIEFICTIKLPDGKTYTSRGFKDPNRAEEDAAQQAVKDYFGKEETSDSDDSE